MLNASLRSLSCAIVLASLVAAFSPHASAQSFNFDYSTNFGSGPWHNAPADTFGGAHGQTGHWIHSEALNSWTNLAGLDGNPTLTDLTKTGGSGVVNFADHPVLNGEFEKMIGDWARVDVGDPAIVLTFGPLARGVYTVYTYAVNPLFSTYRSNVNIPTSIDGLQVVGGAITENAPVEGITHARHRVNCTSGFISISISGNVTSGSFNGVQLVYHGTPPVSPSSRLYVDQDGLGFGGGLNWVSPCVRLEDALMVASVAGGVEEIWVAEGSYRPTRNGNRSDSFVIPDGVKVYGGFASGETALDQRDIAANLTTLSGAINSPLISGDNCYHVVDMSGTSASTRLDGFTISNGYASGAGSDSFGGGVYMSNSSAAIRNCIIRNNHADLGGGIWSNGDSPDFVNCTLYDNDADLAGGGARIISGESVASFYNCRFLGNQSGGDGGGVSSNGQQIWLVNCLFSGNHSVDDGGAVHASGEAADVFMVNTTLSANDADSSCGGIYMDAGADDDIANAILWGNTDSDVLTGTRQAQYFAFDGTSTQDLNYCIVQGWNIVAGVGNNGSNPLLVDFNGIDNIAGNLDDDLRVQITSPAIDSGNNADIPIDFVDVDDDGVFFEIISLDLDGGARRVDVSSVIDTGAGASPLVDRGPYEAVAPCPADTNGDNLVNVTDLLAVIGAWGACADPNNCPADTNNDDQVNVTDLLAVIGAWGGCP